MENPPKWKCGHLLEPAAGSPANAKLASATNETAHRSLSDISHLHSYLNTFGGSTGAERRPFQDYAGQYGYRTSRNPHPADRHGRGLYHKPARTKPQGLLSRRTRGGTGRSSGDSSFDQRGGPDLRTGGEESGTGDRVVEHFEAAGEPVSACHGERGRRCGP